MTAVDPARAARSRHPAARGHGAHLVELARRMQRADASIGPHRDVAVAARLVRGRRGRSVGAFAAGFGLPEQVVADLEAGRVPPDQVPAPLAVLTELGPVVAAIAGGRDPGPGAGRRADRSSDASP